MKTASKIQLVRYVYQTNTSSGGLMYNEEVYQTLYTTMDSGDSFAAFQDYINKFLDDSFGCVLINQVTNNDSVTLYVSNEDDFRKHLSDEGVAVTLLKTVSG